MAAKSTRAKASSTVKKSTISKKPDTTMAIVAYILFFVPLLTESKNDAFVMFHVKQSILLFVGFVASGLLASIPVIGLVSGIVNIVLIVLWIMGILNAINGEKKELPIIGQYASKINL